MRQGALVQSLLLAESSTKGTKNIDTGDIWSRYISTLWSHQKWSLPPGVQPSGVVVFAVVAIPEFMWLLMLGVDLSVSSHEQT